MAHFAILRKTFEATEVHSFQLSLSSRRKKITFETTNFSYLPFKFTYKCDNVKEKKIKFQFYYCAKCNCISFFDHNFYLSSSQSKNNNNKMAKINKRRRKDWEKSYRFLFCVCLFLFFIIPDFVAIVLHAAIVISRIKSFSFRRELFF